MWFCSPGCVEAFADGPRPWPAPITPASCPVCDEPRPSRFVYLVAQAGLDAGYFQWTIRPFAQFGGYLIVSCEADWRVAAWEHLFSGLKLGTNELFERPVDALRVAQLLEERDRSRGHGYQRGHWPSVVIRAHRWQLDLARYAYDEDDLEERPVPSVGAHFTLLRIESPKTLRTSVRLTGEALTHRDLITAVGGFFPGRRAVLAKAWLDLGLAA